MVDHQTWHRSSRTSQAGFQNVMSGRCRKGARLEYRLRLLVLPTSLRVDAGQDPRGRRKFPVRPEAAGGGDVARHDVHAASGRGRRASCHRVVGARSAEQERQRAVGRAVHRHVVPRPLPRSRGGKGNGTVRLADCQPCIRSESRQPLSCCSTIRHCPHQAVDPPDPQSSRLETDRRPQRLRPPASAAVDAGRVSSTRQIGLLRVRAGLHGGLRPQILPHRAEPQSDRKGLRPEQQHIGQLPCASVLRHQRRAHRQARVGLPWHRNRNARLHQLCRAQAFALAGEPDGVAAGNSPAAAHAGRGDATSAHRRIAPGRGRGSHPSEEGPLL